MKNYPFRLSLALTATAIWVLVSARPVVAQEKTGSDHNKKVIVKIISDDDGTQTVIDTTMEFSSSALDDSVTREVEKVIEMGKGGKHSRLMIKSLPSEYSYKFDMPCLPDCPMRLEGLEDMDFDVSTPGVGMEDILLQEMSPGAERRIIRSDGNGQSLNDLLGDIPMSRVKNYSIKDTRNGKRIVIDLDDSPVVQRQDRVIVIREPGRGQQGMKHSQKRMKVTVNTDGDEQKSDDISTEQPAPSSPPPGKK
jgi:hypothetical protein